MIDQRDIELCQNITKQIADFQKYIDEKISDGQAIILFFWIYMGWEVNPCYFINWQNGYCGKIRSSKCRLICPGSGVGSGRESETSSPIIHKISGSVSICEFPGFEDTRGEKEEILHAYRDFNLLSKINGKNLKIKIILVASDAEMVHKRGTAINEMIDRVEKLFSNNSSICNCINLAITGCDSLNLDENGYDEELLNQFKKDNIFLFPRPNIEDDGKVYDIAKTDFGKLNPL